MRRLTHGKGLYFGERSWSKTTAADSYWCSSKHVSTSPRWLIDMSFAVSMDCTFAADVDIVHTAGAERRVGQLCRVTLYVLYEELN